MLQNCTSMLHWIDYDIKYYLQHEQLLLSVYTRMPQTKSTTNAVKKIDFIGIIIMIQQNVLCHET